MNTEPTTRLARPWFRPAIAGSCLAVWFALICFVPDPRPFTAPDLAIKAVRSVTGFSAPIARVMASVALRVVAFGLLGVLVSAALGGLEMRVAVPLGVLLALGLAVLSQWLNFGYFPVALQLKVSIPSAVVGALIGFTLRRSWIALVSLTVVVVGLFLWATSTRITDDLDTATRLTVDHVLSHAEDIRNGDDGFADAVQLAFSFAEDNSHGSDPTYANKAAILALGIILGDEKVVRVARREGDPAWREEIAALRGRVTLRGRSDLVKHFLVSAALVVLTDETRATAVGTGKELLDANPGGSGFSFVDLAANRAGILFARGPIRDAESAREIQRRIIEDGLRGDDYCPEIEDLPEGITSERFQAVFGGLGGQQTREILATIDRRMETRSILVGHR